MHDGARMAGYCCTLHAAGLVVDCRGNVLCCDEMHATMNLLLALTVLLPCTAVPSSQKMSTSAQAASHMSTVAHIKKNGHITAHELLEHLGEVHSEHFKQRHADMMKVVDRLGTDVATRDSDGDGEQRSFNCLARCRVTNISLLVLTKSLSR